MCCCGSCGQRALKAKSKKRGIFQILYGVLVKAAAAAAAAALLTGGLAVARLLLGRSVQRVMTRSVENTKTVRQQRGGEGRQMYRTARCYKFNDHFSSLLKKSHSP